jgi:hypothetical protein
MSEQPQNAAPTSRRHAEYEVRLRPIVAFGLGLMVITGLVLVLMGWLFNAFTTRQARREVPPSPLASAQQLPPEPRLQVTPAQALQQLRAAEDAILHSYGWVDQPAGIVRIPIERAMELLAERGLPTRSEEPGGQ